MASRSLVECAFLIPIRRDRHLSDGRKHPPDSWDWLETELLQFGGATKDTELLEGWYIDPNTSERVRDLSYRYYVALSKKQVGKLRVVLRKACREFCQKCIYLSVAGMVEFVEGTGRGSK